ncbi:Zinc transporter ZIP11 (Solute carrier family 39 member 11) (Zrt- and Irt-like protein 11) (ZIP-11), partial [Durusdinium trenchii]
DLGAMLLPEWALSHGPVLHGLYGTLFTWLVTALGAAVVFLVPSDLSAQAEGKFLDASLGFAAGVMLAASYWSLLAPAIEKAEESNYGVWSFAPAAVGFFLGAVFVFAADLMLPENADNPQAMIAPPAKLKVDNDDETGQDDDEGENGDVQSEKGKRGSKESTARLKSLRKRRSRSEAEMDISEDKDQATTQESSGAVAGNKKQKVKDDAAQARSWRRLLLLVIAVTIHNFPEGLAVGVGFGAVGTSAHATLEAAEILTFGIGIQNFPEGLAVSLPMRRMGYSKSWCFFYGQLSGMVEPLGGLLGAAAVQVAEPILPYALSFAAGAMVYVVVDSLVPEAQTRGNSKLATWGCIVGFLVMMTLDVALG